MVSVEVIITMLRRAMYHTVAEVHLMPLPTVVLEEKPLNVCVRTEGVDSTSISLSGNIIIASEPGTCI